MTKWMETVQRVYKENHGKNPNYKFKQAMTDAKKVYKSSGIAASSSKKTTRRRTKKAKKGKKGKCATGGTRKKRKGSKRKSK